MKKISILSWQNFHGRTRGTIGSSLIRCDWLCAADKRFVEWKHGESYDALILQKVYWRDILSDFRGPIILDICDPDWMMGEFDIVDISKKVKAITASSMSIRDALEPYVSCSVVHVPDRVNFDALPTPKQYNPQTPRTVVWYGYIHNWQASLTETLSALKDLNLKLLVVSNNDFEPMNDYGVEIANIRWEPGNAWRDIQRGDIVLNQPYPFGRFQYKSKNKTVIAAALGMPVAETYHELIELLDSEKRKEWLIASKKWLQDYDIMLSSRQYLDILGMGS